jgi:hypothetical protein
MKLKIVFGKNNDSKGKKNDVAVPHNRTLQSPVTQHPFHARNRVNVDKRENRCQRTVKGLTEFLPRKYDPGQIDNDKPEKNYPFLLPIPPFPYYDEEGDKKIIETVIPEKHMEVIKSRPVMLWGNFMIKRAGHKIVKVKEPSYKHYD